MWNCVCLDKGGHLIAAGDKPQQQTRQYFATIAVLYFCFIIAPRRLNMAQTEHFDLKPDGGIPRGYTSSEEYQAGYEARLRDEAEYHTATLWWRTGWADADRELRSGAAKPHIEQGEAPGMRWSNFGTGQQARICQLPFDENQAEAWKRNWVQTDIAISLAHRAKPSLDSVSR
jgi:hypothetical protein